jgi:hypothetical protein
MLGFVSAGSISERKWKKENSEEGCTSHTKDLQTKCKESD